MLNIYLTRRSPSAEQRPASLPEALGSGLIPKIVRRLALSCFIFLSCFLITQNIQAEIEVVEIIGGDIYRLSTGEEVRLAGVNTKAIREPGKRGKTFTDEALGYIAALFKTRTLSVNDSGLKPDKEGRRQVYLYLSEKVVTRNPEMGISSTQEELTLVNLEVIRLGYGKKKWFYWGLYGDSFRAAQKFSKRNKMGLWRA